MMLDEPEECPDCDSEELEEEEYGYVCSTCGKVIELEDEEYYIEEDVVVDELEKFNEEGFEDQTV